MIGLTLSRKRLHAQLCANLKIRYIGIGYRYRPIRKKLYHWYGPIQKFNLSVIIGIGRYEKMLIDHTLDPNNQYNLTAFKITIYVYRTKPRND